MKSVYTIIASNLIFLFLMSCDVILEKKNSSSENNISTNIQKTYYKNSGEIKSEITVKNNKKNGVAKKYYPTGELHTLVNYVDNVKEGEAIWYYKNGQAYRVTQYINGKMEGLRKKYYENGKLQAEIPFKNNNLIEGTKEYTKQGTLITNSHNLIFEYHDLMKFENMYILKIRLSKYSRKVEFFEEKISTERTNVRTSITTTKGVGKIEYFMPPGSFEMKVLKIYAKYKTKLGNPVLISSSYNLAIENR